LIDNNVFVGLIVVDRHLKTAQMTQKTPLGSVNSPEIADWLLNRNPYFTRHVVYLFFTLVGGPCKVYALLSKA
jgi:hypothetical protein